MVTTDKSSELMRRLWFLLGALIVFRLGSHVPVPGIDLALYEKNFGGGGFLDLINMFSGGSLSRFSVFAMGIMPYISASIIIQIAGEIFPSLKELKKEGEQGKRKLTKYTRYLTVVIGLFQSGFLAANVYNPNAASGMILVSQFEFYAVAMTCLLTGTLFLMWLGEQITERGLGNGISILICAGIASSLPASFSKMLSLVENGDWSAVSVPLVLIGITALTAVVVFFERALRKIPIQYANRTVGNRVYKGESTHLPLKLNIAGVIPPIFASSILLLPAMVAGFLGDRFTWMKPIATILQHGQPLYVALFAAAVIFFSFFYTALMFSPKDVSENLKKSGAYVPGYRPGEQTGKYLEKIILRLTLIGAVYMTLICILPELINLKWKTQFYFGGTSLLIIVVVSMDFMTQVLSFKQTQQYESLMKKANFKGGAQTGSLGAK